MSIDVMQVVEKAMSFPNHCMLCGTCIDSCREKVSRYRFSSERVKPGNRRRVMGSGSSQ